MVLFFLSAALANEGYAIAEYLVFEKDVVSQLLAVWKERGSEADIAYLCVQIVESLARIFLEHDEKHSQNSNQNNKESEQLDHDASNRLEDLLLLYEGENVLYFLMWTLEIHFFRTEHLIPVLGIIILELKSL